MKYLKVISIVITLVIIMGFAKLVKVDAASNSGTTTVNLNIRKGPSTKYKVITTMKKGTQVKILSSKNGWYKVQYKKITGWSSGKYIKKSKTYSTPSPRRTLNVKNTLRVRAYAYSGGGHTALGTRARYGVIAVDPRVIPYRSKVYIKELGGVFVAEDCGGGIKGNTIDIYMNSESKCRRWGRRTINIEIIN